MAPNNPSMSQLLRIVESAGEVIFEAKERLLYPPIVYDGDGKKKPYELYHDAMANKEVGDMVTSHAAAPGMGKTVRRITRMDDTGVYGVKIEDTVQIMEPWMVEDDLVLEDEISEDYFVKEPVPSDRNMADISDVSAYPIRITAKELIAQYGLYLNPGDAKYLEPTNITGDQYSDKWGKTWDWDWILHLKQSNQIELEVGDDLDQISNDPTFRNNLGEDEHGCAQCGQPADGNEELCSECMGEFYEDSAYPECTECGHRYDPELADEEHPELCIPCEDKKAGTSFDFNFDEDAGKEEFLDKLSGTHKEGFELEYDSMYGVYKLIVGDQVILLGTDDYEEAQREAEAMMQDPNFYESSKPYAGTGKEPYATMTDGPDKYLFRKDGKQKLVGSADNEPEDGEEELEETDMDKEIREMQIAAGIIVDEEEHRKDAGEFKGTLANPQYRERRAAEQAAYEENLRTGKWDDLYMAHVKTPKGTGTIYSINNYEPSEAHPEAPTVSVRLDTDPGPKGGGQAQRIFWLSDVEVLDDLNEIGDVKFDDYGAVDEDCPTDPGKNADGECSPLTHVDLDEDDFEEDYTSKFDRAKRKYIPGAGRREAEERRKDAAFLPGLMDPEYGPYDDETEREAARDRKQSRRYGRIAKGRTPFREDDFIEDLLLAPEDPKGPEVDEDDMVYGKTGKGKSYGSKDFHKFGDEDYDEEFGKKIDDYFADDPYELDLPVKEQGPGEFDYDPDAMVDVGDPEDYERYDFENEFETMLGGSSDPVGVGAGSIYEMNEIRRLAGMEPIEEEKAKQALLKEHLENFSGSTYDLTVSGEEYGDSSIIDYARGMVWNEIKTTHNDIKYARYIDTVNDVNVYYDHGADYYFFAPTDEINEIRKLAGMEPIEEKKSDKDYDGDGKIESEEDEWKGSRDKAIKKELDEDKADKDYDGDGEIESSEDEWKGSRDKAIKKEVDEGFPGLEFQIPGIVAYEIADEKAYYIMADLLGAELDFGPEDEILVPAERNDQIIAALTDQGFIEGEDYRVAGQMLDDLQNGYNDRAFTKGQDYFPKGAQSTPASDLGPSASGMADNPMSNKMRMVKKDEVYETMRLAYRRHRKA